MPRKVDKDLVVARHKEMLDLQKKMFPFLPTARDLQKLWNLNTTSSVFLTLKNMEKMRLVVTKERGSYTNYYAIEAVTNPNAQN